MASLDLFDPPILSQRSLSPSWRVFEQVLKWVRNVTKMDIDPECGVAYSLKDGIALCRLMSKLQPGAAMSAASESSLAYKQVSRYILLLRDAW